MEVVSTNPNPDSRLNDPAKSNGDVVGIDGASSVLLGSRWKKSDDKNKKKRKKKKKKLEEEEEVNGAIEDLKVENKDDARDCDEIVNQLDELEFSKSDEEFYNAMASDTSTSSDDEDEDDNKNYQKQRRRRISKRFCLG